MTQISVRDVTISYEKKPVVSHVSFEVESGDYLCVVGENGAGKTTLLKGILGLIPVKRGSVDFEEGVKSNQIGYLPQQTQIQKDFPASVYEVVLSGCLNRIGLRPFFSASEKRRAMEKMRELGIEKMKYQSYKMLSGGQQQRVLLARALCAADRVLLLDEPFSGLDPLVSVELYQIIKELNQKGVTIIMITHDVKAAVENAGKILHLGTSAVFCGTAEAYLQSHLGRSFLGEGGTAHA